jgi:hypothetical protein
MKCSLVFISLFLLTGCLKNTSDISCCPSQRSKLVDIISCEVFKKLKKEKNLHPIECGGRMMDQITLLHWGFCYYNDIGIEEARELLMIASEQFLQAFNADERIRPYLAVYPLTPKNIEIRVFLKQPNGSELGPEKLHVMAIIEGVLDYMIKSSETRHLETVLIETYEEAEAKLGSTAPAL